MKEQKWLDAKESIVVQDKFLLPRVIGTYKLQTYSKWFSPKTKKVKGYKKEKGE